MMVDTLLPEIAGELGLRIKAPLAGGAFGATLVEDREGQELVLKAVPSERWSRQFARGAAQAERMRSFGYPAPLYVATGVAGHVCWSLQERLPGVSPARMTEPHALRLLQLVRMHADAGEHRFNWHDSALTDMRDVVWRLGGRDDVGSLASELLAVLERNADVPLREHDVVHGDFSHRNYLAVGGEVTGIVDWELAGGGDWRLDLVTLAYWALLEPERVPTHLARIFVDVVHAACPPDTRAIFVAYQALRHLDFEARADPAVLKWLPGLIDRRLGQWWRSPRRAA